MPKLKKRKESSKQTNAHYSAPFHDRVSDTYIHPFFNLCSMSPLYRVLDRLTSVRK